MRRALSLLMALLLVTGFAAGLQRPAAAQSSAGAVTEVSDSTGAPAAEISVDAIADPFQDYDEYSQPQRGFRFVLVTITITNVGETPFAVQPYGFYLADSDGFVVSPGYLTYAEGVAAPPFSGDPIASGESLTGAVGFEVLEGSDVASIVYYPSYDRMFVLASDATPPELGTPVTLLGEEGGEIGTVTVEDFTDPLTDFDPSYAAPRGYHYAAATVTIENTGNRPLSVDPSAIQLIDEDGYIGTSYGVYRGDTPEVPDLEYADLAPGDSVTGVVSFTVFEGSAPAFMAFSAGSGQFTVIAGFEGAGNVPSIADVPVADAGTPTAGNSGTNEPVVDEGTPVVESAECADVSEWIARLNDRFSQLETTTFSTDTVEDLDAANVDDILDYLDTAEAILAEQEADTPPALAEDLQTAVLDLLNFQIDTLNQVVDAKDAGDDLQPIFDDIQTQLEDLGSAYFDAYMAIGEACPSVMTQ